MMEHYVTLFDSLFLPHGLALHTSLERHSGRYTLWILCVDDIVHDILTRLDLPNIRLLRLAQQETAELLRVKPSRSRGEYCWTLTPFAPRFVFESDPTVKRVTYVDADLWFRKNPAPIFTELEAAGKNVLITDHAYAPEYDYSATNGQYCVQFVVFTRDGGEVVRKPWEDQCLDWCFDRFEAGRFGDQKYLDEWPERFTDHVHVLQDKELMLAPWNATRFPYGNAIAYHFHGLRLLTRGRVLLTPAYPLPPMVIEYIYKPYLADIKNSLGILKQVGWIPQRYVMTPDSIAWFLAPFKLLHQKLWRLASYKIVSLNTIKQ